MNSAVLQEKEYLARPSKSVIRHQLSKHVYIKGHIPTYLDAPGGKAVSTLPSVSQHIVHGVCVDAVVAVLDPDVRLHLADVDQRHRELEVGPKVPIDVHVRACSHRQGRHAGL